MFVRDTRGLADLQGVTFGLDILDDVNLGRVSSNLFPCHMQPFQVEAGVLCIVDDAESPSVADNMTCPEAMFSVTAAPIAIAPLLAPRSASRIPCHLLL